MTCRALLHVWRLAVKDVTRLDTVVDHTDCPIEGSHEMRGDLALVIHELLAILLTNGDEKSKGKGA